MKRRVLEPGETAWWYGPSDTAKAQGVKYKVLVMGHPKLKELPNGNLVEFQAVREERKHAEILNVKTTDLEFRRVQKR